MVEEQQQSRASRQLKIGKVVSAKMDKTVIVAVSNSFMDPLYNPTDILMMFRLRPWHDLKKSTANMWRRTSRT